MFAYMNVRDVYKFSTCAFRVHGGQKKRALDPLEPELQVLRAASWFAEFTYNWVHRGDTRGRNKILSRFSLEHLHESGGYSVSRISLG